MAELKFYSFVLNAGWFGVELEQAADNYPLITEPFWRRGGRMDSNHAYWPLFRKNAKIPTDRWYLQYVSYQRWYQLLVVI